MRAKSRVGSVNKAVISPGGAYDATILVVSSEYTDMSFFESTQISLSAQNWRILTEAFLESERLIDTRFWPKT